MTEEVKRRVEEALEELRAGRAVLSDLGLLMAHAYVLDLRLQPGTETERQAREAEAQEILSVLPPLRPSRIWDQVPGPSPTWPEPGQLSMRRFQVYRPSAAVPIVTS